MTTARAAHAWRALARAARRPALAGGVALLAGALLPLTLPPFGLWPLGIVSIALLAGVLAGRGWRAMAALGWLYGVGQYGVGVSWVYVSIHRYGHAPPALAAGLVLLFVLAMAAFGALRGGLAAAGGGRGARHLVAVVLAFVTVDWLLLWVLTGFPWLYAGHAHLDTALAGWAPLGGALLLTAWTAVGGVALAALGLPLGGRDRATLLALAAAGWAGGALLQGMPSTTVTGTARVALVQGNIPQDIKWDADSARAIVQRYIDLSGPHFGVDLLVWPEAAITIGRGQAAGLLAALAARAAPGHLLTGMPDWERGPAGGWRSQNLAVVAGEPAQAYSKRRLVPFGEYVPLEGWLRGLIGFFDLPMSRTVAGADHQPLLRAGTIRIATAICYEIAYPELLRADPGDVIVTISNDAWFGDSIGPDQHLGLARLRALETGRWVLRATNDGHTALIGADGRVVAQVPRFAPDVLAGTVELRAGRTPYSRFGDGPVLALAGLGWLVLAAGAVARRRHAAR